MPGAGLRSSSSIKTRLRGALVGLALGSGLLLAGCSVPRHVHDPLPYPETKLASSGFELEVIDPRPVAVAPFSQQLTLPNDFEARARRRLTEVIGGEGPPLQVRVTVVAIDELELVDARGEMTRVVVRLNIEVEVEDGPVLGRVEAQSSSDLPREEASADEIALVLEATANNAFDRYWANPATATRLNRELAAYRRKRAAAPPEE